MRRMLAAVILGMLLIVLTPTVSAVVPPPDEVITVNGVMSGGYTFCRVAVGVICQSGTLLMEITIKYIRDNFCRMDGSGDWSNRLVGNAEYSFHSTDGLAGALPDLNNIEGWGDFTAGNPDDYKYWVSGGGDADEGSGGVLYGTALVFVTGTTALDNSGEMIDRDALVSVGVDPDELVDAGSTSASISVHTRHPVVAGSTFDFEGSASEGMPFGRSSTPNAACGDDDNEGYDPLEALPGRP